MRLYAHQRITSKMVITPCGGTIQGITTPWNAYLMAIRVNGQDKVLNGTPSPAAAEDGTKWGFANEYCWDRTRNNATVDIVDGVYVLIATRTIQPGEEIFWDYGSSYD